jgi:hypothetical protein
MRKTKLSKAEFQRYAQLVEDIQNALEKSRLPQNFRCMPLACELLLQCDKDFEDALTHLEVAHESVTGRLYK